MRVVPVICRYAVISPLDLGTRVFNGLPSGWNVLVAQLRGAFLFFNGMD